MRVDRDGHLALEVADLGTPVARRVFLPEVGYRERARAEGFALVVEHVEKGYINGLILR